MDKSLAVNLLLNVHYGVRVFVETEEGRQEIRNYVFEGENLVNNYYDDMAGWGMWPGLSTMRASASRFRQGVKYGKDDKD